MHSIIRLPRRQLRRYAGDRLRLRYRIVVHPAMDAEQIERLYQQFAAE
jgi:hypothetical protein